MTKPSVDPPRLAGPAARLSRLRIAGFKSFADPVELAVLPGLTGIVGPNGCGKSNVADALRWAMGEGRARTLRGAEMDDVIFAGTATRPGHGRAEVSLTLAWCMDPGWREGDPVTAVSDGDPALPALVRSAPGGPVQPILD